MCQLIGQSFRNFTQTDTHGERAFLISLFLAFLSPLSSILIHSVNYLQERLSSSAQSQCPNCYSKSMRTMRTVPLSKCARAPQETFQALYVDFHKSASLQAALKENCVQRSLTGEDSLKVTG